MIVTQWKKHKIITRCVNISTMYTRYTEINYNCISYLIEKFLVTAIKPESSFCFQLYQFRTYLYRYAGLQFWQEYKWISPLGQLKKCLHMWDLFMWCISWHLPKPFDWFFHYFIFQTRLCINQIHSSCKSRKNYDYVEAILKKNNRGPTYTYINLMYLLLYPLRHLVFISKFSINVQFYLICASKNFL